MSPPERRLGALLLAAGGSRRLGRPKQLIEIEGTPLVRRAADLLLGLEPTETVVVVGASAAEVTAALEGLAVRVHENADWATGMGGSIAAGMDALTSDLDAVLLLLCDQWRLQANDLSTLRSAWEADPNRIAVARWPGAFGPPAIFPRRCFAALRGLSGDAGAKTLIAANAGSVCFTPIDNAGDDLDTPGDLR